MANFLFVWELGQGLGHLAQIAPLAKELTLRGHKVYAALRDLSRVHRIFDEGTAFFLQAPHRTRVTSVNCIQPTRTFPHILFNSGFGEAAELAVMVQAWLHLYQLVQPDLIVFDHSPTALLASRMGPSKRVLLGSGFCCPLDSYPMPDLWAVPSDEKQLIAVEDRVLEQINRLLKAWQKRPLERVSQLYAQVDATLLTTYRELDHYPGRQGATYFGDYERFSGIPPRWPPGSGKKIFAYLKPFPALGAVLGWLKESRHRVIVYGDTISAQLKRSEASPTMCFENQPLDTKQVAAECDCGILNATHSTTVALLKGGKPAFHIPIVLEQWLLAKAVERLGAGLDSAPDKSQDAINGIQALLNSEDHRNSAMQFAQRHAHEDPAALVHRIVQDLEGLLRTG